MLIKIIRIIGICTSYLFCAFTIFIDLASFFFSFREAVNRFCNIETASSKKYILSRNTAVWYNSAVGLLALGTTFLMVFLLYRKRYFWAVFVAVVTWLISFEINYFESLLLR